jgi:hypothetical protein
MPLKTTPEPPIMTLMLKGLRYKTNPLLPWKEMEHFADHDALVIVEIFPKDIILRVKQEGAGVDSLKTSSTSLMRRVMFGFGVDPQIIVTPRRPMPVIEPQFAHLEHV